ncbi:hypothetical protein D9757_011803 [Collybiopsis confluens]|uniref:Uncharacterized protein n=1 Tax=Collybiopsis confluens TaxID=2823264 RepID=A0A8H5LPD4_9AGAR|nr:hypothetical protein D9757_011803 [Collybiopsis confluens]
MSLSGLLNLDDTLGAVYIGYSVSSVIFGIFTMQTISYFVHYRADPWSLKVLVILIWFVKNLRTNDQYLTDDNQVY